MKKNKKHEINFKKTEINFKIYKKIDLFNLKKFNYEFWDFNPVAYKNLNKDLIHLDNDRLKYHYYFIGRYERRLYNYKIKIIIVCETWNDNAKFTSGGNKALYNLGRLINHKHKNNIYAKMYVFNRENRINPFCNIFANDNEINPKTLVIYPDGNSYNPLFAKNVMRWILLEIGNSYRDSNFYKTWNSSDIVYHWEPSPLYNNIKILNTCTIDPIYINKNYDRIKGKSCYLIKKRIFYNNKIRIFHPNDSICIDNLDKSKIIVLFNTCEKFYCYDLKTFFFIGAILCNCKVILIPDNRTKEKFIKDSIFYNFNKIDKMLAWGEDDINSICFNQNDIDDLKKYINTLSDSVDIFLDDIYKYFNHLPVDIPKVESVYM